MAGNMKQPSIRKDNPNSRTWILSEEYNLIWSGVNFTLDIKIPAEYEFDMASVPRIFWSFMSHTDLSIEAPLVHDWIYCHSGAIPDFNFSNQIRLSRSMADNIFLEMMEEAGVVKWRRRLAYWTVRLFGKYPKHTYEAMWDFYKKDGK